MTELHKDILRVQHIIDYILILEEVVVEYKSIELGNNLKQKMLMERALEIIGEAAQHTSAILKSDYPSIPWQKLKDLRNLISHEYFRVDIDILLYTCENYIFPLKSEFEEIKKKLENESND